MSFEPLRYHCPQCGYDLRGQTVDRCPECGFHYDPPALRELGWRAFYARYDPYLTAAKILAPAGILSFGILLCPVPAPGPGSLLFLLLVAVTFLPSSRIVESWVLGSLRRDLRDLDWLFRQMVYACVGVLVFLRLPFLHGLAWIVAAGGVILGLVFVVAGYTGQEDRAFAVTPVRQGLLDRAVQAAWTLAILDAVILLVAWITQQ